MRSWCVLLVGFRALRLGLTLVLGHAADDKLADSYCNKLCVALVK